MKKYLLPFIVLISSPSFAQDDTASLIDFGDTEALTIISGEKTHSFDVEIADDREKQRQGLMFRESLSPDAGMLFEYDTPELVSIWMKNTEIPLDILFILKNGRIVKIEHGAQPQSLRSASSEVAVAAVLELPSGRAAELDITPGDFVQHSFFETE